MKKLVAITLLITIIVYPGKVIANIKYNDGTVSSSCSDCHQECCSHHAGCLKEEYSNYDENEESEDNSLLYLLGINGAITDGYYIGKKRSDK